MRGMILEGLHAVVWRLILLIWRRYVDFEWRCLAAAAGGDGSGEAFGSMHHGSPLSGSCRVWSADTSRSVSFPLALGCEVLNDHDELRHGPLLAACLDRLDAKCAMRFSMKVRGV